MFVIAISGAVGPRIETVRPPLFGPSRVSDSSRIECTTDHLRGRPLLQPVLQRSEIVGDFGELGENALRSRDTVRHQRGRQIGDYGSEGWGFESLRARQQTRRSDPLSFAPHSL